MLYHLSEEPAITRFEPRPHSTSPQPIVWAISHERLCNYLLPRDCPRVTFFRDQNSTPHDIAQFFGEPPHPRAVIAVESAWLDRIRDTTLYCYQLPPDTFTCTDECAGYYQSTLAVTPLHVHPIPDLRAAISAQDAQLRILPNLWPLHDAILASSLSFSFIRMRNALPRQNP